MTVKTCAIILDYRRADLTAGCVNSLAGQVDRVVLVDNSNEPQASRRLREVLSPNIGDEVSPPVTLLEPGRNLGFAAGVNYALRWLQAQQIYDSFLVINNDAEVPSGVVTRLQQALAEHEGKALVAPEIVGDGAPSRLWYHRALGLVTRRPLPGAFAYLTGCCLLVPRGLVQESLFDEDFFMYGEDVELSWRMRRAGVPLLVVPNTRVHHLGSASAPHGGWFYEFHTARGHLLLARKLSDNRVETVLWLTLRTLSLTARASLRALRQVSTVPCRAFLAAWRDCPWGP